jgi:hypothetical protein
MKLLGRKAMSDPAISIMFRIAITHSMRLSWKRSTMSASQPTNRSVKLTGTENLEQVLLLKLLEDS